MLVWQRPLALWILPLIFLFITTTLPIMADRYSFAYTMVPFTGMLSVIMSFILAQQFIGFIHDRDKGDFYFALPASRENLFFSFNAGALGYLIGPSLAVMALNSLVVRFISAPVPEWMSYGMGLESVWSSYASLMLRVIYFFLLLEICYLVTDKAATAIGTFLLINLFWPMLIYLYSDATAQFLPGYVNPVTAAGDLSPGLAALFQVFSPGMFILGIEDYHWVTALLILAAASFAFFLFRRRNTGMAPGVDSINWPFELTQWMGIMTVTLLGGYGAHYLRMLTAEDNIVTAVSPEPFLIGAGLGFLIALWIFNLIRGKGKIRWRTLVPAAAVTLIPFAVWLFVVMSGAGGFSSRLPAAGETGKIRIHYGSGLITERNPNRSQAHVLELSDQEDMDAFLRMCSLILTEENPGLALPRTLASRDLSDKYAIGKSYPDYMNDPYARPYYRSISEIRFSVESTEGSSYDRILLLPFSDRNPDYLELLVRNRRFYLAQLTGYSFSEMMPSDYVLEATDQATQDDLDSWIHPLAGLADAGEDVYRDYLLEEMSRQIAGFLLSRTEDQYLDLLERAPAVIRVRLRTSWVGKVSEKDLELLLPADPQGVPGLKIIIEEYLTYHQDLAKATGMFD